MRSTNTVWHNATVTRERRENQNSHKGVAIWFTGLSGSGKSTVAHTVEGISIQLLLSGDMIGQTETIRRVFKR